MTAVLGILNKNSIALAADSAVTVGLLNGDSKIFNRANKLFALSKFNPVSVMIYNSASFMNTPWEIIIKQYRKKLGKEKFETVSDYQKDFIAFLHDKAFFVEEDDEDQFLKAYFIRKLTNINREVSVKHKLVLQGVVSPETKADFLNKFSDLLEEKTDSLILESNFCAELTDLGIREFNKKIKPFFDEVLAILYVNYGYNITKTLNEKIRKYLLNSYKTKVFKDFTGLIFSGFGETEIYPRLIAVNISSSFNGRLRYFIDQNQCATITNKNPGAICPFAQTDVILTILGGIDPQLESMYNNNFALAFKKYNDLLISEIGSGNKELVEAIKSLDFDELAKDFISKNAMQRFQRYIHPLMNAVNSLSKEDLAEMAESLIYLTYLKRRITFAEESVGGPVDVAIISKGDGFIWIKRKHYFKPELNQQFMNNYFKT